MDKPTMLVGFNELRLVASSTEPMVAPAHVSARKAIAGTREFECRGTCQLRPWALPSSFAFLTKCAFLDRFF